MGGEAWRRAVAAALLALAAWFAMPGGSGRAVDSAGGAAPRGGAAVADGLPLVERPEGGEGGAGEPALAGARYMGEMLGVIEALEGEVSRPGTSGQAAQAASAVRAFCRHAYRVLGKDPAAVSDAGARAALEAAGALRSRALNAMAGLHLVTNRERRRRALARAEEAFEWSSEAHLAEMRRGLAGRTAAGDGFRRPARRPASGAYEPGRGFPAPWWGPESEGHRDFGCGAEAAYRVSSEP